MTRTHNRSRHDIAFRSSTSLMMFATPALAQLATVVMGTVQQALDPDVRMNFEYSMLEKSKQSLTQAQMLIENKLEELRQTDDTVVGTIDFQAIYGELTQRTLIDGDMSELMKRLEESNFVVAYEFMHDMIIEQLSNIEVIEAMVEENDFDTAALFEFGASAAAVQRDMREFEMIITMAWASQNNQSIFSTDEMSENQSVSA